MKYNLQALFLDVVSLFFVRFLGREKFNLRINKTLSCLAANNSKICFLISKQNIERNLTMVSHLIAMWYSVLVLMLPLTFAEIDCIQSFNIPEIYSVLQSVFLRVSVWVKKGCYDKIWQFLQYALYEMCENIQDSQVSWKLLERSWT